MDRLKEQVSEFAPEAVCITEGCRSAADDLPGAPRLYEGEQGMLRMIEETDAVILVNGISGAAGLLPSLTALRSGKDLALANKESLVMAGSLLMAEAALRGRMILPVDSEHAALYSILRHMRREDVADLILTASGGAFRDLPTEMLSTVTYADALKHPTWSMGPKITVDSSSMANKGLEIIEAHRLFEIELSRIHVLIHPQSFVHAMVRTVDGTLHMEAGTPDMRIPIQNALTFPFIAETRVEWLDLSGRSLVFSPLDPQKYRMVTLAYHAAELSSAHPIVYNAANEVAVSAFMRGSIPFTAIPDAVERALGIDWGPSPRSVEEVLAIDTAARSSTREFIS
jgi:1-deoxy-D-xylulose-5-phosphate reductoisomerase